MSTINTPRTDQQLDLTNGATSETRADRQEQSTHMDNSQRLISLVALLAIIIGAGSLAGGIFGTAYTWNQAAAENVVTPDDARVPEVAVRGPLSMWAQADIITQHQLESTGGLRYAEMDRQVALLDEAGAPVVENGETVMVPNNARASWVAATSLTTALSVGMLAYALSFFAIAMGLLILLLGLALRRRSASADL